MVSERLQKLDSLVSTPLEPSFPELIKLDIKLREIEENRKKQRKVIHPRSGWTIYQSILVEKLEPVELEIVNKYVIEDWERFIFYPLEIDEDDPFKHWDDPRVLPIQNLVRALRFFEYHLPDVRDAKLVYSVGCGKWQEVWANHYYFPDARIIGVDSKVEPDAPKTEQGMPQNCEHKKISVFKIRPREDSIDVILDCCFSSQPDVWADFGWIYKEDGKFRRRQEVFSRYLHWLKPGGTLFMVYQASDIGIHDARRTPYFLHSTGFNVKKHETAIHKPFWYWDNVIMAQKLK